MLPNRHQRKSQCRLSRWCPACQSTWPPCATALKHRCITCSTAIWACGNMIVVAEAVSWRSGRKEQCGSACQCRYWEGGCQADGSTIYEIGVLGESHLMLWLSSCWYSHIEVAYSNLCNPRWWEVVASGWWKPGFVAKAIQHRTAVVCVHYCANYFMSFLSVVPSPVCMPKIRLHMGILLSLHSKSLRSENLTTGRLSCRPTQEMLSCWTSRSARRHCPPSKKMWCKGMGLHDNPICYVFEWNIFSWK